MAVKKTTKKTAKKSENTKKNIKSEYRLRDEVISIVLLAATVFLFLCNFGFGGIIGGFFSGLMFGIFGLRAYMAPVFIAFATLFYISNSGSFTAVRKLSAAYSLFFMCGIIIDIFTGGIKGGADALNPVIIFKGFAEKRSGAGIVAAIAGRLLFRYISMTGTILLISVLMMIGLVILTDRSFISGIKSGSKSVMEHAGEDYRQFMEKRRSNREIASIERERVKSEREEKRRLLEEEKQRKKLEDDRMAEKALRTDSKLNGVTFATDLTNAVEEDKSNAALEQSQKIDTYSDYNKSVIDNESAVSLNYSDELHEIIYTFPREDGEFNETSYNNASAGEGLIRGELPYASKAEAIRVKEGGNGAEAQPHYKSGLEKPAESSDSVNEVTEENSKPESIHDTGAAINAENVSGADISKDTAEFDTGEISENTETGGKTSFSENTEDIYKIDSGINSEDLSGDAEALDEDDSIRTNDKGSKPLNSEDMEKEHEAPQVLETSMTVDTDTIKPAEAAHQDDAMREDKEKSVSYRLPELSFLKRPEVRNGDNGESVLKETAERLEKILKTFGVNARVVNYSQGPSVTRYELQPDIGVKVSRIINLTDDIKLNLAATDIRIEAPIPGKVAVGIEVPNAENITVTLRELLESPKYKDSKSNLSFALGKDIGGETIVTDIAKMPHLLIAGSTGSGKSVCINTLILSILYKADPANVKLIMIDPKVVELSMYNGIPHMLIPVVTDPKKAAGALNWAVAEMEKRYRMFAEAEVRDLAGYNRYVAMDDREGELKKLPQIVLIVDELADLMMVAKSDVETAIARLAQLARAAGIHLIIATQRPSVDVITGLIKANMPSRIAFAVSSGVDSRTILDMNGAEKLLGKGDMLFFPQNYSKPIRVQGAFVSDEEIQTITEFIKKQKPVEYDAQAAEHVAKAVIKDDRDSSSSSGSSTDEYFEKAGRFIIGKEKASIGNLQRVLKIGFNRAARIMDQLCEAGVVGEEEGTKPRRVLMTMDEFEQLIKSERVEEDEMS